MPKRYKYTKRIRYVKLGAAQESIVGEVPHVGKVIVLTNIGVLDEDLVNALSKIRIGKQTSGYFHPWEEEPNPAINVLYHNELEHRLWEGERFEAQLTGGGVDDVCWVFLDGYWFYLGEQDE